MQWIIRHRVVTLGVTLAVTAACGAPHDGAEIGPEVPVDGPAAVDGPIATDDGAPNRIAVRVFTYTPPYRVEGWPVVFSRADGSLQGVATTDATGEASFAGEADSVVTVIEPLDTPERTTVVGAQPGDVIVFGEDRWRHEPIATMTVSWPRSLAADIREYRVTSPCSQPVETMSTSTTLVVDDRCAAGVVDLLVAVTVGSHHRNAGYLELRGVAVADGASVAVPGPWVAPTLIEATYTITPGTGENASAQFLTAVGGQEIDWELGSGPFSSGPTQTISARLHTPPPGSELWVSSRIHRADLEYEVHERTPFVTSLAREMLPSMLAGPRGARFDRATRTVSWEWSDGEAPQAIHADLAFDAWTWGDWEIFGPAGATSFTIPVLPPDLARFDIPPPMNPFGEETVAFVGAWAFGFAATYDDVRASVASFLPLHVGATTHWHATPAALTRIIVAGS